MSKNSSTFLTEQKVKRIEIGVVEATHNVTFGEADALLGGARTCTLPDGSIIGVRAPLRDNENPVVRPYLLVEDLEKAVATVVAQSQRLILAVSGHAICPQSWR